MRLNGKSGAYAAKHLKLVFEEFDYGFIYKRVREGQREGDPVWTVGRVTLWPNGFYLGNHFEWRVPIDDENTLSVCWFFMRVPKGREPYVQDKVPTWVSPIKDANGRWISSHVINQDIIAWVGQGTIADRTKENLGASDLGIAMMRKRLFEELDAVARGDEPKGDGAQRQRRAMHRAANITKTTSVEGITLAEHENYPLLKARLKASATATASRRRCAGRSRKRWGLRRLIPARTLIRILRCERSAPRRTATGHILRGPAAPGASG